MKSFYRYIRPLKFNEQRFELETAPMGGVCLLFREIDDDALVFSYARCHPEELFSKSVAKRIAEQRANEISDDALDLNSYIVPFTEDTAQLMAAVIERCFTAGPVDGTHVDWYRQLELRELGGVLQQIIRNNQREHEKAQIWKDGIAAILTLEQYKARA